MSNNRLITDTFRVTKNLKQTSRKPEGKKNAGVRSIKLDTKQQVPVVKTKEEQEQEILKSFDLESEYGPCIGVSRLDRWKRAQNYDLNPPQIVQDIILQHSNDPKYTESVWNDYSNIL